MKFTHNHRIIFLYSTVFILVSLNTVYLPVWLNETINLSVEHIGFLIGAVGLLKVFSNYFITKNIRTFRSKKFTAKLITSFLFLSFSLILFIKHLDVGLIISLSLFILIIFSPILPLVENINTSLNKNFYNTYGKFRISGSIAFCAAVFTVGFILDKFGTNILPLIYVIFSLFFLLSIHMVPSEEKRKKNIIKSNISELLRNRIFLVVLFSCSTILASHAMYYSFSAIYWRDYNINLFQIGFLWFWGVLAEIIFFISIDKIKIKNIFFKAIIFVGVITTLRWTLTFFFTNFLILLMIQSLHAFTFGLTHYLVVYYIYTKISYNNQLLAQSLYHALSSGIIMTILTILAGFSFNSFYNGVGFLIMAVFSFSSILLIYFRGYVLKNERR